MPEFRRIGRDLGKSSNFVSQNRKLGVGVGIVGNRVANFRKNGVGGPTIRNGRVYHQLASNLQISIDQ